MRKHAVLRKLAQARLAINHVLRNRMTKKAEIDHFEDGPEYVNPPAVWPENYAPYYGTNLPPVDRKAPFFPYYGETESYPKLEPDSRLNEYKKTYIENSKRLADQRKALYKTKWKKEPDPITGFIREITGQPRTEFPAWPNPYSYTTGLPYIRLKAREAATQEEYNRDKKQYNKLVPQLNKADAIYRTLWRVDQLPSQWSKDTDDRLNILKGYWKQFENELFNSDYLQQNPEVNKFVTDSRKQGFDDQNIASMLLHSELYPLNENLSSIKRNISSVSRDIDDIWDKQDDFRADRDIREKEKDKYNTIIGAKRHQINDLYRKAKYHWYFDSPNIDKAEDKAVKDYQLAQKNMYLKDLNTYRSIVNMQRGLPPQTPLYSTTFYIHPPIGKNSILDRNLIFRSPITGKPRSYTYDEINNPYYNPDNWYQEGPFGEQGSNFDQHYPRMVKQWAKQDRWDRGVQKFNQTVDKIEPVVGALTGGLSKPIFNAASLARQGVKANLPEYWQRPKHREENGIYTEY